MTHDEIRMEFKRNTKGIRTEFHLFPTLFLKVTIIAGVDTTTTAGSRNLHVLQLSPPTLPITTSTFCSYHLQLCQSPPALLLVITSTFVTTFTFFFITSTDYLLFPTTIISLSHTFTTFPGVEFCGSACVGGYAWVAVCNCVSYC